MPVRLLTRPVRRPARPGRPLAAAVAVLAVFGLPAAPAVAVEAAAAPAASAALRDPDAATVTVTGAGSASAAPDLATVTAGVEVTAPTTGKALKAHKKAADALLAAVRAAGVAERDVRTENVSLSPVYEHKDGTSKLTGYQAAQTFSIKVREVADTGRVAQAAMDAAGDAGRIHGVSFDVADKGELRARAREAAYHDARAKAEQYAELSGRRLGRVVSISESDGAYPRPMAVPTEALAKDAAAVPVAPGEIEDHVTLTVTYELD
ncbi:SIMPL domain-containing protein [Streptomyces sp. NPDC059063]|uniref:SIMPL domain-containing protein n=1 Tax=unclassified Streptomyces TaxID=2593676 RepID=UPI00369EC48D